MAAPPVFRSSHAHHVARAAIAGRAERPKTMDQKAHQRVHNDPRYLPDRRRPPGQSGLWPTTPERVGLWATGLTPARASCRGGGAAAAVETAATREARVRRARRGRGLPMAPLACQEHAVGANGIRESRPRRSVEDGGGD